jgi:hypothetical protein
VKVGVFFRVKQTNKIKNGEPLKGGNRCQFFQNTTEDLNYCFLIISITDRKSIKTRMNLMTQ